MPKFTSIALLLQEDREYLKEAFDGTRFKLMDTNEGLAALTYGESRNKQGLSTELDAELASLGAYTINVSVYWEVI